MRKKVRLIKWIIFLTFILSGCSIEEKITSLLPNKNDFINYFSNVYIYNIQEGYELDYATGKATVSN